MTHELISTNFYNKFFLIDLLINKLKKILIPQIQHKKN